MEETFQGSPGNEIEVFSAGGRICDCGVRFQVGHRYLVAANSEGGIWTTGDRDGTRELQGRVAEIELRALREWKQGRPLTRSLSGMVEDRTPHAPNGFSAIPAPAGIRVVLSGAGFRLETRTDLNGWFQFDQLPAARLHLSITVPPGWKAAGRHELPEQDLDLTQTACVAPIVSLQREQGQVRGRIRREDGWNPHWLPVSAIPAGAGQAFTTASETHTNDQGEFLLENLEPGEYLVGVHVRATPNSGLVVSYYPGVSDRALAQPIRVERGGAVTLSDWTLPRP